MKPFDPRSTLGKEASVQPGQIARVIQVPSAEHRGGWTAYVEARTQNVLANSGRSFLLADFEWGNGGSYHRQTLEVPQTGLVFSVSSRFLNCDIRNVAVGGNPLVVRATASPGQPATLVVAGGDPIVPALATRDVAIPVFCRSLRVQASDPSLVLVSVLDFAASALRTIPGTSCLMWTPVGVGGAFVRLENMAPTTQSIAIDFETAQ